MGAERTEDGNLQRFKLTSVHDCDGKEQAGGDGRLAGCSVKLEGKTPRRLR